MCSCKKLVAATKQMSILQAPNVLVIQLKVGFVCDNGLSYQLSNNAFHFFLMKLILLNFVCRDLRAYSVGRLIRPLHSKRFWCFQVSCVKQARYDF